MPDEQPAEDIFTEVAAAQPGTWPTSPLDLIEGQPAPSEATEGWQRATPATPDRVEPLPKRPPATTYPAFSASLSIHGDVHHYELHATGSAHFIERMTSALASAFFDL